MMTQSKMSTTQGFLCKVQVSFLPCQPLPALLLLPDSPICVWLCVTASARLSVCLSGCRPFRTMADRALRTLMALFFARFLSPAVESGG